MKQIQKIVVKQLKQFEAIYQNILRELALEQIYILNENELSKEQKTFVHDYFTDKVRPKLIPLMMNQFENFHDLKDHAIYLAIAMAKSKDDNKETHALIEVPTGQLSRFLVLPSIGKNRYIILLDDVIRLGLKDIFSFLNFTNFKAFTIKVTRDAELDFYDDFSASLIKKMAKSLKHRKEGNPVRFIYDENIPESFLNIFIDKLNLDKAHDLIAGTKYHNFKDFIDFPNFGLKRLRYVPYELQLHKHIKKESSLFKQIEEKDILLHFCYQPFDYVIDLLREAAIDPKVLSIQITLYRVGKNSNVINALINAARNGKRVLVVMELQARFDEEANIFWSNKLKDEGVTVMFGIPGLKVHSKLCLITRQKKSKQMNYAIIGTGNFNEDTANIYSDHALFTADKKITNEVSKLFDYFDAIYKPYNYKHLIVSPFNTRKKLVSFIQKEINNAKAGKKAYIILKLNNLVDRQIIENLYNASRAGVKITLLVRGMMSLVPGIKSMSENIEAFSIVDKFLEHSRIYIFCNNNKEKYFISSADIMPRNLDRRIEVTCPIYSLEIQKELKAFIECQLMDNVKARIINKKMNNSYRKTSETAKSRAQWCFFDYLKNE
ncbi:MAG: polyphosphate kinase 1 [Chlorobi bacterium]|nr:polyphosphate kinase 1 [Chlorobiota bacterium]